MSAFQSEMLKYKRTLVRKLAIFIPLFFVLLAVLQKLFMDIDYIQLIIILVFNWWTVTFLPIGMALVASLVALQEKKAGNYRGLLSHNISPMYIWLNKVIILAIHTLFSTLVLALSVVISCIITAKGDIPLLQIITASIVSWIVSLPLIPIQLWVATWKGIFFSISVGFVGMIIGVLVASKSYWVAVPWSWSIRLMCPIIGVHPNGILLEDNDPLLDMSVIPTGIILSLIIFITIIFISAFWFNKAVKS